MLLVVTRRLQDVCPVGTRSTCTAYLDIKLTSLHVAETGSETAIAVHSLTGTSSSNDETGDQDQELYPVVTYGVSSTSCEVSVVRSYVIYDINMNRRGLSFPVHWLSRDRSSPRQDQLETCVATIRTVGVVVMQAVFADHHGALARETGRAAIGYVEYPSEHRSHDGRKLEVESVEAVTSRAI